LKISIKKYVDNSNLSWEERYKKLEEHHLEETFWMIEEIKHLESAIKKHRDQTGHNMCWENDQELWAVLNDDVEIDHTPPAWDEFMLKCVEYRKSKDSK